MNGRTILFAWELGGGFGHVTTLARVARALAARGHRPVFAHREYVSAWPVIRDLPYPVLPAPHFFKPLPPGKSFLAASFTDILGINGYDSVESLLPLARAWDGLIAGVRPDLIVTDYAPTLAVVAGGRIPVVDVGHGFTQPPTDGVTFPPFLEDEPPTVSTETVLATVRAVQKSLGRPEAETLPQMYAGVDAHLCVLPEMDPFTDLRPGRAIGPLEPLPEPSPLPAEPWFFAYLTTAVTSTEPVLEVLRKAGFAGGAYIRGDDPGLKDRLRGLGLELFDRPPPLPEVFRRARVIVHHAGLQTAQAALAAGRPQLVFPEHLEHILNAAALFHLGVAHSLTHEFPANDVAEGMRQLLFEPRFANKAADVAERVRRTGPWDALPKVLAACEKYLSR